jgi:thiol-disulfide isomerase/thioredoxin
MRSDRSHLLGSAREPRAARHCYENNDYPSDVGKCFTNDDSTDRICLILRRHFSRCIAMLSLALSLLAAGAESQKAETLPSFHGKSFEAWLAAADSNYTGFEEAAEYWDTAAVPLWVQRLRPSVPQRERNAALRALEIVLRDNGTERLRSIAATQAVPVLVTLVRSERGFFRSRIVNALRAIGPGAKAAAPELITILRDPVDPDGGRFSVRSTAARALGDIQEPREEIITALRSALVDTEFPVRKAGLSALQAMSWRAISATNDIESVRFKHGPEFARAAEQALIEIRRPRPLLVGDTLPDIKMPNFTNSVESLSRFKGKLVVLDFWSSTCPPCQPAMSKLNELAMKRADWKDKVVFVGINEDDALATGRIHAQKRGWKNIQFLFDEGQKLHDLFRSGLPELILADSDGRIIWRGHPTEIALEEEIRRLLR